MRVLVLLCTHNGGEYLLAQWQSLAGQTLRPHSVLVHDWGSQDGSPDRLCAWQASVVDPLPWLLVRHPEAPGACASFLQALAQTLDEEVDFDWLLLCDQDDIWRPNKIAAIAELARTRPELELIFSDYALIDADGRPRPNMGRGARPFDGRRPAILFANAVPGMTMALRRNFLQRSRHLWADGEWWMHDWLLCICAHALKAPVGHLAQPLVEYRQHATNQVGARPWWRPMELLQRLRRARSFTLRTHLQLLRLQERCPDLPSGIGRWALVRELVGARLLPWFLSLTVACRYLIFWPRR